MSEHFTTTGHPGQIMTVFALQNGQRLEDLTGPSKTQAITRLRHELMYLMRQMTVLSYSDIGRHLGGRDMATVHEGVGKVADRIATDPAYRDHMRRLRDGIIQASLAVRVVPELDVSVRVALSVLTSTDLSDAEARAAATDILMRFQHPLYEVTLG
jgi:hypothetical protein